MQKVPYDMVAIEADKILNKILTAKDSAEMLELYNQYSQYIQATGWSMAEFELATLEKVNENWTEKPIKKSLKN